MKIKNRQKSKSTAYSCVALHDSVSMSLQNVRLVPRFLLRVCLAVLGICSAFASLFGFFEFHIAEFSFFAAVIALTVLFAIGFRYRKLTRWMCVIFAGVLIFCFWKYHAEIIHGFSTIVEIIAAGISRSEFRGFDPVSEYRWSWEQCVLFSMMLSGCVISFILTALTIRKPSFCAAFLILVFFIEIGLYRGLRTDSMAVFGVIAYWAAMIVLTDGDQTFGRQHKSNAMFVYSEHALYAKPNMRFMPTELVAAVMACVVLLFGGAAHIIVRDYQSDEVVDGIRASVRERWVELREKAADFSWLKGWGNGGSGQKQPGDLELCNRQNPVFTGETDFTIQLSFGGTPQTMYLKEDTGSIYTGSAWRKLSSDTYDVWSTLFDQMHSLGIVPQAPEYVNPYLDEPDMSYLTYLGAPEAYEKYLPYRAYYDADAEFSGDTAMLLTAADSMTYRFASYEPDVFTKVLFPNDPHTVLYEYISSKHRGAYEQYDSFVRVNYLQVPANDAMDAIRADAAELLEYRFYNTQNALFAIRDYLSEKAVYTLTPPVVPEDEDYASYFLLESGEGYCVHYATAAVLLCRMMGIPARYAQGYVVFESDFNDPEICTINNGVYTVQVPDNRAHAWAEIYLPGYGWLPFEFTAGYTSSDSTQGVLTEPAETTATSGATSTTTTTTTSAEDTTVASSVLSSDTSTSSSAQQSFGGSPGMKAVGRVVLKIIISIFIIVSVIWLYLLLHCYIFARRERYMTHGSPNQVAMASYRYLLRLLAREGIVRQPQQSHESFALAVESACSVIAEGAMQRAVGTSLAATFSREGVSREQADELTAFVQELVQQLYQTAPPLKRILMRWGYHDIK